MSKKTDPLERSINSLKTYTAPDLWHRIESSLDDLIEPNQQILSNAINDLKTHEAPDIWTDIDSQQAERRLRKWPIWVAASIALSISMGIWMFSKSTVNHQIVYDTEYVDQDLFASKASIEIQDSDELLGYIKSRCDRLVSYCEDPEFKALYGLYIELDETKRELNQRLSTSTNANQIMKYLIQVEKEQTNLGLNLLKKIQSI